MATILRENLKSTHKNWCYIIREVTVPDSGPVQEEIKEINCSTTATRRRQYGMGFEKLVGNTWFIITPTEFLSECSKVKNPKVKIRKASTGEVQIKPKPQIQLMDRIKLSVHCRARMELRFDSYGPAQRPYLEARLPGHFIVQNFHFYNSSSYQEYNGRPEDLVVCSQDYRHVWIMALDRNGMLEVKTCYNPYDSEFDAFDRWFNDHMHEIHEMPTLHDYLAA